ncbi:MAG: aldehyde dehydrogenase family protein, partial [Flavobacteriaceae bacterium]|nr:aldehyde dehydrogenase family protein [Flavobacteriaceae bacterium]
PTAGAALGRHMDVDKLAFTGSTEVGRYFLTYAAESNGKSVSLELGGKTPQIVLNDCADLDAAASSIAWGVFYNSGQTCHAGTRLVVEKAVEDELLEKITNVGKSIQPGDPYDPTTAMGTIVDINGSYSAGEFVDVNATAYENYEFIMWSGGTFTDPYSINTQLLVDNNLNIKAQFEPKYFFISVPLVQVLEQQVQGHGTHTYGSTVNLLSSQSPPGYRFSHWLENDEVVSISNPYSFTVTSDRHLSAVYLPQQYNISITSSDGGTIDRVLDQNGDLATEFFFDSNYSIHLSPNINFKFSNWSSDVSSSSLSPKASEQPLVWSFSPEANATFHAEFDIIENYLFINAGVGAESVYPSSNMF